MDSIVEFDQHNELYVDHIRSTINHQYDTHITNHCRSLDRRQCVHDRIVCDYFSG